MISKIFHLADIHIRKGNHVDSRFIEYNQVFDNLLNSIKDKYIQEESLCVICGDIFHHKLQISPPGITLFYKLVHGLATLMPVIIIQGNHDLLQENHDKSHDLIEALLENNPIDNVYYYKKTGTYIFDNINFGVVSIVDMLNIGASSGLVEELPKFPKPDESKFNIALSHCTVKNCYLHNYTKSTNGIPIEWFKGYDIVMLGDIHLQCVKYNTKHDVYYGYPGSLVQQDFGESIYSHGFLEWNIDDKNGVECIKHHVQNDYARANIKVHKNTILINANNYVSLKEFLDISKEYPKNIHIRLYAKENTLDIRDKITESFENHNINCHIDILSLNHEENNQSFDISQVNITSLNSVETIIEFIENNGDKLILEKHKDWEKCISEDKSLYFENKDSYPQQVNDMLLKKNTVLNTVIEKNKDILQTDFKLNNLKILSIKFDWILAFGRKNIFEFNQNKIILINAPNGYGKSAFFECIVLGLFGEPIPSRYNKTTALSILSKKKPFNSDTSNIEIKFNINEDELIIKRNFYEISDSKNKQIKRLFCKNVELHKNGELIKTGANVVNKWIEDHLCSIKDFLLSTMITQNSDNDFFKLKINDQISLLDSVLHIDNVNNLSNNLKLIKKEYKDLFNHLDTYIEASKPTESFDLDLYNDLIQKQKKHSILLQETKESFDNIVILPTLETNICKDEPEEDLSDMIKYKQEYDLEIRNFKYEVKRYEEVEYMTLESHIKDSSMYLPKTIEYELDISINSEIIELRKLQEKLDIYMFNLNDLENIKPYNHNKSYFDYECFVKKKEHFKRCFDVENISINCIPTKPTLSKEELLKISKDYELKSKDIDFNLCENDIENKLYKLRGEINKYSAKQIEKPKSNYKESLEYLRLNSSDILYFNDECWACNKNIDNNKDVKKGVIKHQKVIDEWTKYYTYHEKEIELEEKKKEIFCLEMIPELKQQEIYINKLAKEQEVWNNYVENKETYDKWLDIEKEELEWKNILEGIRKYEHWEKMYNRNQNEIDVIKKNIIDIENKIYVLHCNQTKANTLYEQTQEIEKIIPKINWYANKKYELKHTIYVLEEEDKRLLLKINDLSQNKEKYYGFIISEKEIYELKEYIKHKLDLFEYIINLLKSYKSWIYNEKLLPVIVTKTNNIVKKIFLDRVLELCYTFYDNTVLWSVKDEGSEINMEKLSGAQSFAISLCFRLALASIGITKFKCNQLFIDEGFCSFDQNNLLNVPNLIRSLKTMFHEIILVTHLTEIKNCADEVVNIIRDNGISYIKNTK